jgi:hypothetical protein
MPIEKYHARACIAIIFLRITENDVNEDSMKRLHCIFSFIAVSS